MPDRPLPRPSTTVELYLAAILDELQAEKPEPDEGEDIELREVEVPIVYTALPENFPGYDALIADGIIYLESVPATGAELVAIPGIGKATANRILTLFKS